MWILGLYSPFLDWFRLISIGMAKNEFCNNKGIFFLSIKFNVIKQRIYFDFSFSPSFLPFPFNPFFSFDIQFCCPLYLLCFTWNCGWLTF